MSSIKQRPLILEPRSKFEPCRNGLLLKGGWTTKAFIHLSRQLSTAHRSRADPKAPKMVSCSSEWSHREQRKTVSCLSSISCKCFIQLPSVLCIFPSLGKAVSLDTIFQLSQGSHRLLISHCTYCMGFAGQQKVFPVIPRPHPRTGSRAWKIGTS